MKKLNIVFTGKVELDGKHLVRRDLVQMVEMFGHTFKTSVSRSTDLVVVSEQDFLDREGSKLKAADRLGIPTITVPELLEKLAA